ncbi:hypothetical protein N8J89_37710 [Crossiella sp. CA-258035]|uniref:hypothetical protein n=1 Tax=Crossiella sp. CA-258035 TaxID=2981138 RepID=UPI0024BCDB26|nr:hypothetical protein [Crossiella sp. CA-258035]WHT18782.1 hypothetical protein N8J89_37710 [Crossiella sp. CA-258035]
MSLKVGDVVEVLGAQEILSTLDERGELDELPFMPEMLRYCGQRMTVHKVAHKLCDSITHTGLRRMARAVHLTGARCDGSAHGGCQTACSLYWKEDWLRKIEPGQLAPRHTPAEGKPNLPLLVSATTRGADPDGQARYACQATEILRAAPICMPVLSLSQYVTDVRTGNVGPLLALRGFLVGVFNRVQVESRKRLPRWLLFRGGRDWGFLNPGRPGKTPTATLNLQPGELVRIRPRSDIEATLDDNLRNRGMSFDEEMAHFCGRTARVLARVDRCIDERTGRMLHLANPCIVLEGVVCLGRFNVNCPREFVPFWREIWLERVPVNERA